MLLNLEFFVWNIYCKTVSTLILSLMNDNEDLGI